MDITHKGIITSADDRQVTVRIAAQSNECRGCAIASLCSKPTEVSAPLPGASAALVGRTAIVGFGSRAHRLATLLYLGAPLVLMLAVLCIMSGSVASQLATGTCALGSMCAWYAVLFILRKKLRGQEYFQILSLDPSK